MTRAEAVKYLKAMKDGCNDTCHKVRYVTHEEALDMAIQALSQEPCDDIAKERYKDLCEYFGGAEDILKSREDFKAWLERVKWHIRKAEELYEKYEYKKEPCDDAISRQAVLTIASLHTLTIDESVEAIKRLPSVRPQESKWIIKKNGWCIVPKCHTCKYLKNGIVPCNRCKNHSEFEPQESEDKE